MRRFWILHREDFLVVDGDGVDDLRGDQLLPDFDLDPSSWLWWGLEVLGIAIFPSHCGRNEKTSYRMNPNSGSTVAILGATSGTLPPNGQVENLLESSSDAVRLEIKGDPPLFCQGGNRGQQVVSSYFTFVSEGE